MLHLLKHKSYFTVVHFGCSDILEDRNGLHQIYPLNFDTPLAVYCDERTNGGGLTVSYV